MNNLGEGPALRSGIRDPGACATPARVGLASPCSYLQATSPVTTGCKLTECLRLFPTACGLWCPESPAAEGRRKQVQVRTLGSVGEPTLDLLCPGCLACLGRGWPCSQASSVTGLLASPLGLVFFL